VREGVIVLFSADRRTLDQLGLGETSHPLASHPILAPCFLLIAQHLHICALPAPPLSYTSPASEGLRNIASQFQDLPVIFYR
jgi:hypothetical protein